MEPPPLAEVLAAAHVVAIPTRTRFRNVTVREAVLFDAPNGASEFSPFPEYADSEAAAWLGAALEFGWGSLPQLKRERIEINATVPAVQADQVSSILARFDGCRTAKVKVAERGQTLADDVARVRAVREAMGDEAKIRIDANGTWSLSEAHEAIAKLSEFGIEYAEQPCASVEELAALRERLAADYGSEGQGRGRVLIAADESVRKAKDPLTVARARAADLLVVKAQPLGGVGAGLAIVEQAGLPVVVSSALETSVGISMGLHLAAALPEHMLAGACGLGTAVLLEGDITSDPQVPERGELPVRRSRLDPDLLAKWQADPERTAWWRSRITRCYELLSVARGSAASG